MALSKLPTESVGLPKSGSYNIKYAVLADAPYEQYAKNAVSATITYNANGTFTLAGQTYTPTYVLKTAIADYIPSYPVMVINVNGTKFLIADPSFDLTPWKFTMPSMVGQTGIFMSRTDITNPALATQYNATLFQGSGWTGMSSSPVAPPPDPDPTPSGYLPATIDNVYIYTMNTDGTVSAQNSNTAIGPLTAQYDGTTWKYVDAQGNAVLTGQNTATGVFQVQNGFVSYNSSGQYVLVSNDKITDPSSVKWSNDAGAVPGTSAFPAFAGASASLKLQNLTGSEVITYDRISGGVTKPGVYDPNAHLAMPAPPPAPDPDPKGYLPGTIDSVYIYTMNTDGTVSAQNSNTAIGPLTAQYDGTTWKYVDAQGNAVLTAQNTTTGVFQVENGFISYNSSGQYVLVSNDKIADPTSVKWSNDAGAVPGTSAFPAFAGASASLQLQNLAGNEVLVYDRISGGVTKPGYYLNDAHINMPCFLAGTMILTAVGYKPVEALELSDEVAIFTDTEVRWSKIKSLSIGVCKVNDSPYPDLAGYPVIITQNALGRGIPFKNLRVTADHAIEIDGELYLARSLVDGEKIYFDRTVQSYPYYHIDLHDHHVIDADGARAESYGDNGYRDIFNNADIRFNKDHIFDSPISFRPACQDPSKILATRQKLDLKPTSAKLPASLNFRLMTDEGEELPVELVRGTRWSFVIPPHVDTVSIVSATARPYDAIGAHVDDRRRLGLLVNDITVLETTGIVKYDGHLSKRLCHGWSTLDNASCRWTAGNARIDLNRKDSTDTAILTINVLDNCLNFGKHSTTKDQGTV